MAAAAALVAALALAGIAHLIGEATDKLGNHLSPAATGIVQSAVGNLPELFICVFALRAGLVTFRFQSDLLAEPALCKAFILA